jgi:hypothetical protein
VLGNHPLPPSVKWLANDPLAQPTSQAGEGSKESPGVKVPGQSSRPGGEFYGKGSGRHSPVLEPLPGTLEIAVSHAWERGIPTPPPAAPRPLPAPGVWHTRGGGVAGRFSKHLREEMGGCTPSPPPALSKSSRNGKVVGATKAI